MNINDYIQYGLEYIAEGGTLDDYLEGVLVYNNEVIRFYLENPEAYDRLTNPTSGSYSVMDIMLRVALDYIREAIEIEIGA